MLDTGDLVRIKGTRDQWIVACRHGPVVYLNWPSPRALHMDDLEIVQSATPAERRALLEVLAQSSGKGHRPVCARERLGVNNV